MQYDEEMTEWKTGKRAEKPKFHLFGCGAAPGASLESRDVTYIRIAYEPYTLVLV